MIGFFRTFEDLQNWARGRAQEYEEDYRLSGNTISLGYAMAMRDIVRSEMGPVTEVPAYQRALEVAPAEVVEFPSRHYTSAA